MIYCDFINPLCDAKWEKSDREGWYTISISGMKPKNFCCRSHAIFYMTDPMKHSESDDIEPMMKKCKGCAGSGYKRPFISESLSHCKACSGTGEVEIT